MKPRYASSKTKLAACLGISRQYLHAFFLLPDSPAVASNGMHSVEKWRKFIAARAAKVKGAATEKERLQVALLQARLEREQLELAQLNNTIRSSITNEICAFTFQVIEVLKTQIQGMPDQLSGRFSGLAPIQIYKLFKAELHERFQRADDALQKLLAQSKRKTRSKNEAQNIVPFERSKAAMGAGR